MKFIDIFKIVHMLHASLLQLDHFKSSSYTPERANEKIEPNWQKITRNIKQNFMAYYLHVEPKQETSD